MSRALRHPDPRSTFQVAARIAASADGRTFIPSAPAATIAVPLSWRELDDLARAIGRAREITLCGDWLERLPELKARVESARRQLDK